jgi:hypothetical protein
MLRVQTIEDVYPALDELIVELRVADESRLAAILDHRLHHVAWTTRAELFEELRKILAKAVKDGGSKLPRILRDQMQRVSLVIDSSLGATTDSES